MKPWERVLTLAIVCVFLPTSLRGQLRRPGSAQEGRDSKMPEFMKSYRSRSDQGNFVRAVLRNGLTVIVEEYPAQPVACVGTYVQAGYLDESDDIVGVSHVMEHMFFKGTVHRPVGQVAKDTRVLGGTLNASTIYDHTWYYSVVPSENLNKALEIQADALQDAALDAEELKKELEVVVQEGKRKWDDPGAFATEKLLEIAFEKHRMRRWRIGTEGGLRSINREKLSNFYRQFYTPDRIILVVVGDVQRDRVLEKVAALYGQFQRPSKVATRGPGETEQTSLRYMELRGDIQQTQIVFGYHDVGREHPDYYPLVVLSQVLGGGRGSIFYQQLMEKERLVDAYEIQQMSYPGVGMFLIRCTLDPAKIDRAEAAALAEIELLRSRKLEPAELQRAVALIEKDHYRSLEDCESRAAQLAHFQALGDYRGRNLFMEKVRQVTADQVRAVAQRYLRMGNLSVLEYQPTGASARQLDATKLKAALDALVPAVADKRRGETISAAVENTTETVPAFTPDFRRHPLGRTSVLRGPEIYYKEDHTLPIVDIAFLFPGGRVEEQEENRGITELSLNMAVRESDRYRDGALPVALEGLGGTLQAINAPDYYGFVLSILSRNLGRGVKLLTEVILRPVFRKEALLKEKELQLSRLRRMKENNLLYPLQLCREALFGTHPYGFLALGTEKSVAAPDVPQVEEWYQQNVTQAKPMVVILGDIQGTAIAEQLARDFSGSRYKEKVVAQPKVIPLEQVRQRAESRDIKQTATLIGFTGPAFSDRDSDVLDVIRNIVSGLGGRFFEELRDRQHLAYTVSVLTEKNRFGGAIYGYIATSPETAERAEKGLLEQFAAFTQGPIKEEEYYRALMSTIGGHTIGLQSRFNYLNTLARYWLLSGDADQLEQYPSRIKSITIEEIKAVAKKYFTLNKYASGIVRGAAEPAMVQ
ncbi:MAG: insulinase family protein [Acidobacteria bacterium]|nr:insulinase family protein [Acidobacteriota bacterium]